MSGQTTAQEDRTWRGRLIGAGIVLAILLLFVLLNNDKVEVNLLIISPEMRLGFALLIAAALGFLAGLLFPRFRRTGNPA